MVWGERWMTIVVNVIYDVRRWEIHYYTLFRITLDNIDKHGHEFKVHILNIWEKQ